VNSTLQKDFNKHKLEEIVTPGQKKKEVSSKAVWVSCHTQRKQCEKIAFVSLYKGSCFERLQSVKYC
jgi:hypothetical protein